MPRAIREMGKQAINTECASAMKRVLRKSFLEMFRWRPEGQVRVEKYAGG